MTKDVFRIGDYVEIVKPVGSAGMYDKGDRGFIVSGVAFSITNASIYVVEFDSGVMAPVYGGEMQVFAESISDADVVDSEESYMILAPLYTFQITPCGADAPGRWFDHSNGNFLNAERLQRVLDGYRNAGVVVV